MLTIHPAAKSALDGLTNSNVITPNTGAAISVLSGGADGNAVVNTEYELGYKYTKPNDNTINVYARTGQDGTVQTVGNGAIVVRTFDIPSASMLSDRIQIWYDAIWAVYEYMVWDRPNDVWIYLAERARGSSENSAVRFSLLKSTDGKVGRSFSRAKVLDYVATNAALQIPLSFVKAGAGGTGDYIVLGVGQPAGLRLANILPDGDWGTPSVIVLTNGISEGSFINAPTPGTILGVYRNDSGNSLLAAYSTDFGATWTSNISTGVGAATGAKPTPTLLKCANNPNRVITLFNDRGSLNNDRGSGLNPISAVLANTWNSTITINGTATQGNGQLVEIGKSTSKYLYCVPKEVGSSPVLTDLRWWVLQENYTKSVSPNPWR